MHIQGVSQKSWNIYFCHAPGYSVFGLVELCFWEGEGGGFTISFTVHPRSVCTKYQWHQDHWFREHVMMHTFKQHWVMKFCTKLYKQGHPRKEKYCHYLTAAWWQCAQPHVSTYLWIPGEAKHNNAAASTHSPGWLIFLRKSGTGSTQPREDNWVATWLRSSGSD